MSLNSIILKNFFKNLKNYTLYIFALVFSVALYFSFVLMSQDEKASEELFSSKMMVTGFTVGSVLLVVIIVAFVVFANAIFLKRRNRELALFQLIGLNRGSIFRILVLENAVIYFGSLLFGVAFGFLVSRLLLMALLRILQVDIAVGLNFSVEAVIQTAILFVFIFLLLMIQNFIFLKKTRLINMLKLDQSSELGYKKLGAGTVVFGIFGIVMIALGYYLSANMLDYGRIILFLVFAILFLTIAGTYITFKFSIAFLLNTVRKSKNGQVNVNDVLSLTSIMFKMKSNAFLLTLISVISALSMGLMSFAYISYYSVDQMVENSVSNDYVFYEEESMHFYEDLLNENSVEYESVNLPTISYLAKEEGAISVDMEMSEDMSSDIMINLVSDEYLDGYDVGENDIVISGVPYFMDSYTSFEENHPVTLFQEDYEHTLELTDTADGAILPAHVTLNTPTGIVDSEVYDQLESHHVYDEDSGQPQESFAIDITEDDSMEIFELMDDENNPPFESKIMQYTNQMQSAGLLLFITGFVGVAFLITSGCILYFKQVGESEDEKGSYNVLRRLGFSEREIMRGLTLKMVITFGIPLLIGLLHTYFAVNAGWFLFGSEMWTPMFTVMGGYIILYSVFAFLSLTYYKKVVRQSM